MIRFPTAYCKQCSAIAEAKLYSTFSYWYCHHCKDEVDVRLDTTRAPKGEMYGSLKEDSDITISTPGIYSLTYSDGSHEWYEHKPGARDTRLGGRVVRSATRIADRDMPGRKRMQSAANTSQGTPDQGPSLRTVSDQKDCIQRDYQAKTMEQILIDIFGPTPPAPLSRAVYTDSKGTLRYVDTGNQCLQFGQVPPDDTI